MDKPPKKLLDQVRDLIRLKHYSILTEQSYIPWIKRYIYFHKKRHPKDMGVPYKGGHPKRLNIFLYLFHLIGKGSPTNSRSVYLRLARRSRKSSRSFLVISIFITSMLLLEHSENPDSSGPIT